MNFKKPKHLLRWIIFCVAAFAVRFIIAKLFMPAGPVGSPTQQLMPAQKAAGGATQILPEEQDGSPLLIIAGVVMLLLAVVAYGYYIDRKNKA